MTAADTIVNDITDDRARVRRKDGCVHPYESDEPSGYIGWHEWAKRHDKTYRHTKCPNCDLYVVCRPR